MTVRDSDRCVGRRTVDEDILGVGHRECPCSTRSDGRVLVRRVRDEGSRRNRVGLEVRLQKMTSRDINGCEDVIGAV